VGVVNLAVLACVLRTTSEKGHTFLRKKKSAPTEKNPDYACARYIIIW